MSNELPSLEKPILAYATLDADGLPEFIPEAEELISAGEPPKAIRRFFRRSEQAVRYFGKSMSRRYNAQELGQWCAACNTSPARYAIQLGWVASSPFRKMEIRISRGNPRSSYTTLHPICPACACEWFHMVYHHARLRWVLAWASIGCIPLLFLTSAISRIVPIHPNVGVILMVAFLGTILLRSIIDRSVIRGYPQQVRDMTMKGVTFTGIKCLFARDEGGLRTIYG